MFVFWFPNTYLNVHIPYLKTEGGVGGRTVLCADSHVGNTLSGKGRKLARFDLIGWFPFASTLF